jgi:hypothetical protein
MYSLTLLGKEATDNVYHIVLWYVVCGGPCTRQGAC